MENIYLVPNKFLFGWYAEKETAQRSVLEFICVYIKFPLKSQLSYVHVTTLTANK